MLHGIGVETGIDLTELVMIGKYICKELNKVPQSKVTTAFRYVEPCERKGN